LLLPALVQVRVPIFATCIAVLFLFIKPADDVSVEAFNVATRTAASN
jgi:hypothetical protein